MEKGESRIALKVTDEDEYSSTNDGNEKIRDEDVPQQAQKFSLMATILKIRTARVSFIVYNNFTPLSNYYLSFLLSGLLFFIIDIL